MSTGYYLIDNPNPHGDHFYKTRRSDIRLIVMHTAENLPEFDGSPDTSAEKVAHYGATTSRSVSWHVTVDSDSVVPMIPDSFTGWHVRGYNSSSLGVEIATQSHLWPETPGQWRRNMFLQLAPVILKWAQDHSIPVRRITRAAADAGERGIIGHSDLDPDRRRDPGAQFPWDEFFATIHNTPDQETPDVFIVRNTQGTRYEVTNLIHRQKIRSNKELVRYRSLGLKELVVDDDWFKTIPQAKEV